VAESWKVLFLGSGDIACPILTALHRAENITLTGVVTQPDRPAGRKRIPTPTPLARCAEMLGIPALKVTDVNAADFLEQAKNWAPDLLCVVSFGQILKMPLLSLPKISCVNIHASLLPAYRGASPIAQAILHGDARCGVAFMQMEAGLDSGPVYRMLERPLTGQEYADSLEMELGELAASAAPEVLREIAEGKVQAVPQDPAKVTICRKIAKAQGKICWQEMNADTVDRMIRGYFPWPGAWCEVLLPSGKGMILTICRAEKRENLSLPPGKCALLPGKLVVGCAENSAIEILELTPAGAKRMSAAAFCNGLRGEFPDFSGNSEEMEK